jgi:hypothetical protein
MATQPADLVPKYQVPRAHDERRIITYVWQAEDKKGTKISDNGFTDCFRETYLGRGRGFEFAYSKPTRKKREILVITKVEV